MITVSKKRLQHLITALSYIYGGVLILVGLDKFFCYIINWNMFLSPTVLSYLPPFVAAHLLTISGVLEMVAGGLVLYEETSRFGLYLACILLGLIVLNACTIGMCGIIVPAFIVATGFITLAQLITMEEKARQQ